MNTTTSLNWTTIGAGDDDIYLRAVVCDATKLHASGFPTGVNVAGIQADPIVVRSYTDPATCAPIEQPTPDQMVHFRNDGTVRTDLVALFGTVAWWDIKGIRCSGSSNALGRGCITVGSNGASLPSNIKISYSMVEMGDNRQTNPTGIMVTGNGSGGYSPLSITLDNITIRDMGGGSATGLFLSNADGVTLTNSTITGIAAAGAGVASGILIQTSTQAHRVSGGHNITGNTITNNMNGIRYAPFGADAGDFSNLQLVNITNNILSDNQSPISMISPLRLSRIANNIIDRAGQDLPVSALSNGAIYMLADSASVLGSSDLGGTVLEGNLMRNSARFALWLAGVSNVVARGNVIVGCGQRSKLNTYGRCIEITKGIAFANVNASLTLSALSGAGVTATAGGATFVSTDLGKSILGYPDNAGMCKVVGFTSSTVVTCNVLVPFLSLTAVANAWRYGGVAHDLTIDRNFVSGASGSQYATAPGTEGVGLGLDDGTARTLVRGNTIYGNEWQGIQVNAGPGNVISGNTIWGNGTAPLEGAGSLTPDSIRRAGILTNVGVTISNNTIDCRGRAVYGIASENTTTSPATAANGGVVTVTGNVIENCGLTALLLNENDIASGNLFWKNGRDYAWMNQLSFSSSPAPANLTTQALDVASVTGIDPQLDSLGQPTSTSSPVCGVGAPAFGLDANGRRFAGRKVIGGFVCPTFSTQ